MALEDRVKALEEEVAILKGQIHCTLLEIQEQVLTHYYPDLRAQHTPPDAAGTVQGARRRGSLWQGAPQPGPLAAELPEEGRTHGVGPGPEPGEDAQAHPHAPGPAARLDPLANGTPDRDRLDWTTITRLMQWATESVQRIGRRRTVRAIEACARGGHIDEGVQETLLKLIALDDMEPEANQVSPETMRQVLLSLNEVLGYVSNEVEAQWLMGEGDVG